MNNQQEVKMDKKLIAQCNEEIEDKLDVMKCFIMDQTKEVRRLKNKILKEIAKK